MKLQNVKILNELKSQNIPDGFELIQKEQDKGFLKIIEQIKNI